MKSIAWTAGLLASLFLTPAAHAQDSQTVRVYGVSQDFSDNFGSLRSAVIEYKAVLDDTTLVASPTVGERRAPGVRYSSVGGGAAVYERWSDKVSTSTQAFVAEDQPIFANLDFSQDITVAVAKGTTVTIGGRWARYFGGTEVTFLSVGARRYFKGGSIAYRLTRTDPQGRDAFLSHLVNLTLNDRRGGGKTQLWLGAGSASLERTQLEANFTEHDLSGLLQRTQPLTGKLALIGSAGVSRYARPGNDVTSTTIGLGLQLGLN